MERNNDEESKFKTIIFQIYKMRLSFYISRRYTFSKNVSNVVHIISRVAQISIIVVSFALIVIFSVFNGFTDVVSSLYDSFDSDIKISPVEGKYLKKNDQIIDKIKEIPQIKQITPVIEENVLIKYANEQVIAKVKAIKSDYLSTLGLDTMVTHGQASLYENGEYFALVGVGLALKMGVSLRHNFDFLKIYVPKKEKRKNYQDPRKAFDSKNIYPNGIFSVQNDFDERYILVPLEFMQNLTKDSVSITSIEVNLTNKSNCKEVIRKIKNIFGQDFLVQNRLQQHDWLFKIMKSEKFAVYMILLFVLLIAAFNLIASLLMLTMEKRKDFATMRSMGAKPQLIRNIIFLQGFILSASGALIGIFLGAVTALIQKKFEIIKMDTGNFVFDAYPVSLHYQDFFIVFITVIFIGFLASYVPAMMLGKDLNSKDLN